MDNREFDELGDKIQDIIDKAINSQNYQKLNQTISQTVNKAVDTGSEALRSALNTAGAYAKKYGSYENKTQTFEEQRHRERMQAESASGTNAREAQNTLPALYKKTAGFKAKGVVMAAAGGIVAGGMGLGCLIQLAVGTLLDFNTAGLLTGGAFTMAGALAGAALLVNGCRRLGMTNRFKKYLDTLGRHTYCNFDQLSKAVGKPLKYVKKDIKAMISRGWFLEGHVDSQETCLITSDETYRQYEETKRQLELRRQEEAKQAEARQAEEAKVSPQVQEVLDRGNEYLRQLRACNDAIPGEEISAKISRMELIVEKIFERVKTHPEIIPDLKKLMDYYLPMTIKLLKAYDDMDDQPVQGENITASKKEIEDTLDTLNQAFEKLFDSIFQDTAWDVSSDISVLHTMLAQEGLTENDFTKMQREAEKK